MGILIAIDGLDGSGKGTQSAKLQKYLEQRGHRVRLLSFPRYGERGCIPVEMYLGGELGENPEDTNAYAASTLFSVDRYVSYRTDWKKDKDDPHTILISDRYTTANAVHQLSKLPRTQWEGFLDWLWDYEFEKLGLPRPDVTFYLEMTPDHSMHLVSKRAETTGRKKDIHELSKDHLTKSYDAAMFASDRLGWQRIRCYRGEEIRSIEEIGDEIIERLSAFADL